MGDQPSVIRLLSTRLRWVLLVQVATLVVATAGFVLLADYGWFDALYMSVITLGTVGYGEVRTLDNVGRTWAMLVIAGGFAVLVYSGAVFTSLILSGDLSAALARQGSARMRERLHDHVIVVGRVLALGAAEAGGPLAYYRGGYGKFSSATPAG